MKTFSDGLSKLLEIQSDYSLNVDEFNSIIRRLHVDYYEEGRMYLQQAKEDQHDIDMDGKGNISVQELKWLINKYGRNE